MRSTDRNFIALLIVAALAACGGGGSGSGSSTSAIVPGSSTPTATPTPTPAPAGYLRASFSITIPKSTGSASRDRLTIGSGTQSITFKLLQSQGTTVSGTTQTFPLTATSPGCTTSGSNLVCTLGVNAPIGLDVFLAQTFTNTDGTGSLTGSGAVQLDVALNSTNTASLSLTSQVSSVYLASTSTYLGDPQLSEGSIRRAGASVRRNVARSKTASSSTVTSAQVFVIALDSAGNTILNPSIFSSPVSLQLVYTDGYGDPLTSPIADVTLSVAYSASVDPQGCGGNASTSSSYGSIQVCSPADVITASVQNVLNGAPGATIIGSVGSTGYLPVPAPSTTPAPFPTSTPANVGFLTFAIGTLSGLSLTDAYGDPVTSVTSLALGSTTLPYNEVYIEEQGFNGNFTLGGNCAAIATLSLYNSGDGFGYFTIVPTAVGTCTATVSDGTTTLSLPITVTTTTVTGS